MNGIYGFFVLIAVGIVLFLGLMIYNAIKIWLDKRNNSIAISVFEQYGYRYHSSYNYKGKGLIYRKQLDTVTVDSLLLHYDYEPLDLNVQYRIFDYVALLKYPEWEERCYNIVAVHGGVRLSHFYALEVVIGDKVYYRPFSFYFDNDRAGKYLYPVDMRNQKRISNYLSDDMHGLITKFYDEEILYWKNKTLQI